MMIVEFKQAATGRRSVGLEVKTQSVLGVPIHVSFYVYGYSGSQLDGRSFVKWVNTSSERRWAVEFGSDDPGALVPFMAIWSAKVVVGYGGPNVGRKAAEKDIYINPYAFL